MRTPCNSFLSTRDAGEKVKLELPADVVMTFAWCPAGSFRMGGTVHNDEQPIHKVTLTKGFYIGIYPVTQAQWKAVMGTDPSHFKGANRPVESVTWHECNEFCTKLSDLLNGQVTVRLPSEAEWEYACRSGTTTEYHFGNVINTDLAPIYSSAIPESKKEGTLRKRCRHRPVQYLNNILEQDHRAIKRRVKAKQGFREFQAARRTIQGYEAVHMIRKGQVRCVAGDDLVRQIQFIDSLFDLAA